MAMILRSFCVFIFYFAIKKLSQFLRLSMLWVKKKKEQITIELRRTTQNGAHDHFFVFFCFYFNCCHLMTTDCQSIESYQL